MSQSDVVYEVGDEILTECGKCKTEMHHVITAVKDDKIKRVMCKGCNTTHIYRNSETVKETKARKPRKKTERKTGVKTTRSRTKSWDKLVADVDNSQVVEYTMSGIYEIHQPINHRQFGLGVITKVLSDTHIEVIFQDSVKILVYNYK